MKKTLGGDRLGSGKKMQVELHGYERSTHDLGYIWRSTMSAGTLVPFMSQVALPGDTWDINLDCDIKTHPTIGPLFGSFKVQLDIFQAPIRLYQAMLHNNALNIGRNMSQVKLPRIAFNSTNVDNAVDLDNSQINPSCILAYLGIRGAGVGAGDIIRYFNAVPFLAYWEIYKNYYANKQEELGVGIHTAPVDNTETVTGIDVGGSTVPEQPAPDSLIELGPTSIIEVSYAGVAPNGNEIYLTLQYGGVVQLSSLARMINDSGTVQDWRYNFTNYGIDYLLNWRYRVTTDVDTSAPRLQTFALSNIDDMRTAILQQPAATPFTIDDQMGGPYAWPLETGVDTQSALYSQEGLGIKTYQSDLFNNWLDTEWIDGTGGITEITAISTVGDSFTLDTLNLSKKVYDMLNRIAVSGGTYDDWLDVVYDHDRYTRAESPIYCGGLIKELVFQEVVSNAQSAGGGANTPQPLGTLAGKGVLANKHKGGTVVIKVDEPSYIMGIISLTPRIDYSQGNSWDVNLRTLDDLHKPALDEIGFQELIKEQMAWWDTTNQGGTPDDWTLHSAGKQPAWMNYMTNVNVVRGNFAIENNEMFMTLNRKYQYGDGDGIIDMTTYIDPVKYNNIFAETQLDAQNFWAQIAVDITARRKMSAKIMPNL